MSDINHWNFKDPINLWTYPFMRNIAADNRARSLQLKPRKRNTHPNSRIVVEPARGVGHSVQTEQILFNIARRNGKSV
jgi:hypothetical protein